LDLLKVDVLKSSPFEGHATKEELAPAEVVLFVDKSVVVGGIFGGVKRGVVEPGVDTVEKKIDEVGASGKVVTRVTECFEEAMPPGLAFGVVTTEEMVQVFGLVLTQVAFVRLDGIVSMSHFCRGEDVMAELD
jgi:hypothetical protein